MATRVSLEALADGRVAVVKVALTGDRQDRQSEARWLAEVRHRGVVQLLGVDDDPVTLRTLHAGSTTLRTANALPRTAAILLADAAVTLADLHDRGIVHGQITLDHLIVCEERVLFCSPDGTESEKRTDLTGLGQCIQSLLERWDADKIEVPDRKSWIRVCSRLHSNDEAYSARRAARELARLGAKAGLTTNDHRKSDTKVGPQGSGIVATLTRAPIGLALGAGAFVVAVAGLVALGASNGSGEDESIASVEVLVGDHRYEIPGEPGDQALAFDLDCETGVTVAYLQVATSSVWIFGDPNVAPIELAIVPGATGIEPLRTCDHIEVVGPAGKIDLKLEP